MCVAPPTIVTVRPYARRFPAQLGPMLHSLYHYYRCRPYVIRCQCMMALVISNFATMTIWLHSNTKIVIIHYLSKNWKGSLIFSSSYNRGSYTSDCSLLQRIPHEPIHCMMCIRPTVLRSCWTTMETDTRCKLLRLRLHFSMTCTICSGATSSHLRALVFWFLHVWWI